MNRTKAPIALLSPGANAPFIGSYCGAALFCLPQLRLTRPGFGPGASITLQLPNTSLTCTPPGPGKNMETIIMVLLKSVSALVSPCIQLDYCRVSYVKDRGRLKIKNYLRKLCNNGKIMNKK